MAFSQQLEEIIKAALADGVITEKERAVLHKKALQEGVDPDEVDVVIDGRLQQMQNEVDKAKQKVRKCPSCGEIIPAMTAVCPSCGQVIDTSNPDNKALLKYMDKLEAALVKLKENGASKYNNKVKAELEGMIRQGKAMYGDNKKINYLISEIEESIVNFDKAHRNHFIMKIAGVILVLLLLGGWQLKNSLDAKREEQHRMQLLTKAENQCDSLCALIDKLPAPNRNNYKECEHQLLSITWKDISCDDEDFNQKINEDDNSFKHSYILKKRAYANQIYSIYKDENTEDNAPDELSYPTLYMEN